MLSWRGSPGYNYDLQPADQLKSPIDPATNAGSVRTKPLTGNTIFHLTVSNGTNRAAFVTQSVTAVAVETPRIDGFAINGSDRIDGLDMGDRLDLTWRTEHADRVIVFVNSAAVALFERGRPPIHTCLHPCPANTGPSPISARRNRQSIPAPALRSRSGLPHPKRR